MMRREQENAGATSASRMEIGAGGRRGDGMDWGAGGRFPNGWGEWRWPAGKSTTTEAAGRRGSQRLTSWTCTRAVQPGPNCNGNVVFTCTREGWGFRLVTLAKILSPKLRATPAELLKSRCVQLYLSSAEEHVRLCHIVFEVNSIYSTLRPHRPRCLRPSPRRLLLSSFSTAASLLPAHRRSSSSGFYLPSSPNGHHPSPCRWPATVHLSRDSTSDVLFMCTHGHSWSRWCSRPCSSITMYSIPRLLEILSPIPMVWLTRDHDADACKLPRRDVAVCPKGMTCREPFLLRFSTLFAELSRSLHVQVHDVAVSHHSSPHLLSTTLEYKPNNKNKRGLDENS
uniref:Uncharacterized protein n=1 Tax=Oryza punctata TaxID=4537 RepID=A0A0E0JDY1_ORYPU